MHQGLKAIGEHVTRWKIESEEESKLASKADINVLKRKEYCEFYRNNDPIYYENGVKWAREVINRHGGCLALQRTN